MKFSGMDAGMDAGMNTQDPEGYWRGLRRHCPRQATFLLILNV